ncbi:hypothetical protein OUZ56_005742 [Daphnia magna]|uniref:Uncharacterized protein n=1 Tax=Daphnia magna TaxID=35525 RepID=A0ABQ9YTM2_9CRUS|nr:hypothetical protein OUZ56_005742 [Daphnia magna]
MEHEKSVSEISWTMELASHVPTVCSVVGKNKNRGRSAEGNQKQKKRRNKHKAQKSNVFVNVPAPEVATQEEAIGDGDLLILDVMPSTSGDITSHKTDVVADASGNEGDISTRHPLNIHLGSATYQRIEQGLTQGLRICAGIWWL